ncbi:MAG: Fic family protein, partial [Candidatus Delongbacteria bacterium]|nr:Fic family protein [Candidatus Delongbacteria bacterium]
MIMYIYEQSNWPEFIWNSDELITLLSKVRNAQGKLLGSMESLGFDLRSEALLGTLTLDVIKSTEIEGQILNADQVRSSIARRLGLEISGLVDSDRNVEGVVDMMMDATQQFNKAMSKERLFGWHSSLFPSGRSGMFKITTGDWRKDQKGLMQVVSGAIGKEKVHFQAPAANLLDKEIKQFIEWFNKDTKTDLVLKAGLAHLRFVTLHPFDDGNGRIARALTDMLLARSDMSSQRFYSMSAQIRLQRKEYYDILEKTQKGNLDVTGWLRWFLTCLSKALDSTDLTLKRVLEKSYFWKKHSQVKINDRQNIMLNKMLDGFEGQLTSKKWAKITHCSTDTALRDIQDLIGKKIL